MFKYSAASFFLCLTFGLFATTAQAQIGIGTTNPNPASKLHVAGKALIEDLPGVATANRLLVADQSGFVQSVRGTSDGEILRWSNNEWALSSLNFTTVPPLSGVGTPASPFTLAPGQNVGDAIQWSGSSWISAPNSWGTQVVITTPTLSGNGTNASPLTIAQAGATTGQALKWNGTQWFPADDVVGDDWGAQFAITAARLKGQGTTANPLDLAQNGANVGQVLKWNGTAWDPGADDIGIGDNWGTQAVVTNPRISGNGTSASPLDLAQNGATNGQILKWNGTSWSPATDNNTVYSAGTGISIAGTVITNSSPNATHTGDATGATALTVVRLQNRAVSAAAPTTGQVLKWNGNAWAPAAETGTDNWGTQTVQTNARLTGAGTAASKLDLAQNGATTGQIMKWNGTAWAPANNDWGTQTAVTSGFLTGTGVTADAIRLKNGTLLNQVLVWDGANWNAAAVPSTPSDRRLKTGIEPLNYGLNEIMRLNPVTYTYTVAPEMGKKIGFIAQEVQPIVGEIVQTAKDENKTLSVKYDELVPVLVKAIQEQQKIIEKMSVEIEKLSANSANLALQSDEIKNLKAQAQQMEALLRQIQSQPTVGSSTK